MICRKQYCPYCRKETRVKFIMTEHFKNNKKFLLMLPRCKECNNTLPGEETADLRIHGMSEKTYPTFLLL